MLLAAPLILGYMTHHPLGLYEDAEVLIMAKTYPVQSHEYNELVCTAGLRIDTNPYTLIRLYPIPFRQLSHESQYSKWEVIKVKIRKRKKDHRPESYGVDSDTIQPTGIKIGTRNGWSERCSYLSSYLDQTDACTLLANAKAHKTDAQSLALVKPRKIISTSLDINPEYVQARKEKPQREQVETLFGKTIQPVWPSPVILKYTYLCQSKHCRSHTQSVIDWEVQAAAYNQWQKYGSEEAVNFIRKKFITDVCSSRKDLWFFVGNVHKRPADFMILSFFYPDRGVAGIRQPTLCA